jgi:hypothetical protein
MIKDFIEKINAKIQRGKKDLEGSHIICAKIVEKTEIHHIKSLRKKPPERNFSDDIISTISQEQVLLYSMPP